MAAPQPVVQAVQAGVVASAHLAALEAVTAAAQACQRLGSLTSGRWRSAARDLTALEEDLQTGYASVVEDLAARAEQLGVPEEALWTVGDASGTLDLLRESAIEEVDEDDERVLKVLQGQVLFGASFVEDQEVSERGTTLLFGWPAPLEPASWPWQANWVVSDDENDNAESQELDLFESGEMEGAESMLAAIADELGGGRDDARAALRGAAMALTRASLLAAVSSDTEGEDEDDDENGV